MIFLIDNIVTNVIFLYIVDLLVEVVFKVSVSMYCYRNTQIQDKVLHSKSYFQRYNLQNVHLK